MAAADNIDHNLSSNTAQSSFHGTAISLTQFPVTEHRDNRQDLFVATASESVSDIVLPVSFTDVPPCILPAADPMLPPVPVTFTQQLQKVTHAEHMWLATVDKTLSDSDDGDPGNLSWAAFHAEHDTREKQPLPVSALMPLFRYSANNVAMVRHCFAVVKHVLMKLNPGQIPVLTFDQPLFALAKQVQWHWPDCFGEDKCVVMLGGLHIEMVALRMIGLVIGWMDQVGCIAWYSLVLPHLVLQNHFCTHHM